MKKLASVFNLLCLMTRLFIRSPHTIDCPKVLAILLNEREEGLSC